MNQPVSQKPPKRTQTDLHGRGRQRTRMKAAHVRVPAPRRFFREARVVPTGSALPLTHPDSCLPWRPIDLSWDQVLPVPVSQDAVLPSSNVAEGRAPSVGIGGVHGEAFGPPRKTRRHPAVCARSTRHT